jgi:SAM-dependent methyltransferase
MELWGGIGGNEFFSGQGSLDKFAAPYVEWLTGFIAECGIKTIVDLGCGDFRIGQQICSAISVKYVGVDIVLDLIAFNQSRYGNATVSFKCVDIIEDELPDGDLCLIRQVLQHLSNAQISRVLTSQGLCP